MPIFQSSTFRFETNDEFAQAIRFDGPGYVLAGVRQPDGRCVPVRDGRPGGVGVRDGFASGLAAILALLHGRRRGRGWSRGRPVRGPSRSWSILPRYGVETTFVDPTDLDQVREALPGADLFYCETIVNPTTTVPDLAALASLCREAGVLSAVDNTFASPYLCNPVALGFDVALHSATKYVGGHADPIGGVACTSEELFRRLRDTVIDLGASMPLEAWLCLRGLATLSLRMEHHCASAAKLAEALAAHPAVEHVHYPGLPEHPQHEVAARRSSATSAARSRSRSPAGSRRGAASRRRSRSVDRSLGSVMTLVAHPPPRRTAGGRGSARGRDRRRAAAGRGGARGSGRPRRRLHARPRQGMKRRRVAVLFGGRSAEHEISCISARSVIDVLDPGRNEVVPIGITREGRWHRLSGPPAPTEDRLDAAGDRRQRGGGGARERGGLAGARRGRRLPRADRRRVPVLHGPFGEDGTIQGLLELAGVPYVGAGVLGSAIGMDKDVQKRLFREAGLPVGAYEPVHETDWRDDPDAVVAASEALGFPVFTKPATLGSSVGVAKVRGPEQLAPALDEPFRYARLALVERAFEGVREIECAILGNDEPVASVAGEIVPEDHEFYDYDAKYLDERGAQLLIPADLKPEVLEEIQRLAVGAFRTIRCAGMARVDFFLEGEDRPWLNELNTVPGFTSISMYPKLWEASGLPTRNWSSDCSTSRSSDTRPSARARGSASWAAETRCPLGQRPRRANDYRWTTGQVRVRVIPSIAWIRATTSFEVVDAVGLGADDHVVGTGHVLGLEDALRPRTELATEAAFPTSVWIRM